MKTATQAKSRFSPGAVRALREKLGWTQYDLSIHVRECNPDVMVTPAAISKLENGHQSPELETACAIANALGVGIADVLE